MTATGKPAFRRLEASIILVSMAMLMLEILQTVTLSLQTIERNAFLVVSLCLLGLGGGGSIATWLSVRKGLQAERVLWASALAFGLSAVVSGALCSWSVRLPILIILGVVPYVFVGLYLAFVFRTWPERANRLYFMNLLGSALGCTSLLLLLDGTGDAGLTILIIGAMAVAAALLLADQTVSRNPAAVSIVALLVLIGLVPVRNHLFAFLPSPKKGMGQIVNNPEIESEVEWSRWGYLGRLDVLRPGQGIEKFHLGGIHTRRAMDEGARVRYLFASGGNWTRSIDFGDNSEYRDGFVRHALSAAPFGLVKDPDVLVIGLGGGVDAFLALKHGADSVVAVEINPLMIEAGRGHLSGYYDDFYNDTVHWTVQ